MAFIDLTGQKIHRLTIIERIGTKNNSPLWLCKCDCGNFTQSTTRDLRCGHTKSCGCYSREICAIKATNRAKERYENLIGQRFGRLIVKEQVENVGGHFAYLCKCDCGNESIKTGAHLISGDAMSCGCLLTKTMSDINKKVPTNNTTGVVGVSYHKKTGKYRSYITINNKQIHLGMFNTIEQAKKARLDGEIKYGMRIGE